MCHVIIGCTLAALLVILGLPRISCDAVVIQKRVSRAQTFELLNAASDRTDMT